MAGALPPQLIAGLGNPGPRYEQTRHNIGFLVLDALASRARAAAWRSKSDALVCEASIAGQRSLLVKPQSFMNLSGRPVGQLLRFFKAELEQLIVVHDDVDLAFGQLRVKRGGGDGGHNGIRSLVQELGSADFFRVRCGVGRPESPQADTAQWVLGRFSSEEQRMLTDLVERAADAVEELRARGLQAAQNRFNRRGAEAEERGRDA